MELLKTGSLSPLFVLDLLLRGNAAIPGVEVIGQRVGSRGVVIGIDTDTVYAIGIGATPSDILLATLHDLVWLKEEESLVRTTFPKAARPFAGIILAAEFFPPRFATLAPLFSFPCRFFRTIALETPSSASLFFEPYPTAIPESRTAMEGTTEEEERYFSSW